MPEPTGNFEPAEVLDYDPRNQGAEGMMSDPDFSYHPGPNRNLPEDHWDRAAVATEPAGLPERTPEDDIEHALREAGNTMEARMARMVQGQ